MRSVSEEIALALSDARIEAARAADAAVNDRLAHFSPSGRMGSGSLHSEVNRVMAEAFDDGLTKMLAHIKWYAGHAQADHADLLEHSASALKLELLNCRRRRLESPGRYTATESDVDRWLSELKAELDRLSEKHLRDCRLELDEPASGLSLWKRYRKEMLLLVAGAVTGSVLDRLIQFALN